MKGIRIENWHGLKGCIGTILRFRDRQTCPANGIFTARELADSTARISTNIMEIESSFMRLPVAFDMGNSVQFFVSYIVGIWNNIGLEILVSATSVMPPFAGRCVWHGY